MSDYRKAVVTAEKSNNQEIRRNIRRIFFESMKVEDNAYDRNSHLGKE